MSMFAAHDNYYRNEYRQTYGVQQLQGGVPQFRTVWYKLEAELCPKRLLQMVKNLHTIIIAILIIFPSLQLMTSSIEISSLADMRSNWCTPQYFNSLEFCR